MSQIESLTAQALADIAAATAPDAVESLRVALLGKNGQVTAQLKALGTLPADQRKAAGEAIDVTLPGRNGTQLFHRIGRLCCRDVGQGLLGQGFDIAHWMSMRGVSSWERRKSR